MATLVQQGTPVELVAAGTPLVFQISMTGITAGNLVVVTIERRDTSALISDVDGSLNGQYVQAAATNGTAIWYKENSASGNETLTIEVASGANQTCYAQISEWSGLAASASLDQSITAANTGNPTSHPASTGITTTGAGVIIGTGALSGANTVTPASGFTALTEGSADPNRYFAQYKISSGVESTTATFTTSSGQDSQVALANFLDAVGGSAPIAVLARNANTILRGY